MNEHHLPPDELASAFLDDELAETEAEDVRRDPESAARADALRRAADAVGEPVTPPAGAEDSAVAAALAEFDARHVTRLDPERRRPRSLPVITGIAAAVAVGFIVAAAVGLFAEQEGADEDTAAAAPAPEPAPAPAPEAPPPPAEAAAAAPPPPPEPAPADSEAMEAIQAAEATAAEALEVAEAAQAAADLAQATAEGNEAAVAAAEAALAAAQAATDEARAEAAAAQAEAAAAQAEASEARTAAAAAEPEAAAPAAEPAAMEAAAADDMADDMGPPADADTALRAESCAAAVGDGAVKLQIIVGETPVLIIHTIDERFVAINGTTCGEIPPAQPPDALDPLPPESCVAAVGKGRVALHIIVGETPVLIIHTVDGRLAGLDGDTCSHLPPTEPG